MSERATGRERVNAPENASENVAVYGLLPAPARASAKPIGQILLEGGLITMAQLDAALESQAATGGTLGRNLILDGAVNRIDLFEALAEQWNTPFVNLLNSPPDAALMDLVDPYIMLDEEWVPYRQSGPVVIVAAAVEPTPALAARVRGFFKGSSVRFVTTTDWDVSQIVTRMCRNKLLFSAAEELATVDPGASAKSGIAKWQRTVLIIVGVLLVLGLVVNTAGTLVAIGVGANLMFLSAVIFKTVTSLVGIANRANEAAVAKRLAKAKAEAGILPPTPESDRNLPMFTILIPAFHESNIIDLLMSHIDALDWPKSKLQVLILAEEVDEPTVEAVKNGSPPEYVRLLVVPEGTPQTKPRACNFGLLFAKGEYLVIYDCEDRPDPDQLRKVHAEFTRLQNHPVSSRPVVCLQAALNYFNWDVNVLTRMFTLEYSSWFDAMLPGMDLLRLPIPLGGTSNHFRTDLLRRLGGWDPYNVTEDADLGLRSSAAGFTVGTVDSTTWEEACSKTPAWIRQRTRWIKGYMVTALVDLRHPFRFLKEAGPLSVFTVLGLIAGTPLMFLAYPLVWGMTIITYVGVSMASFSLPPLLETFALWNAVIGNLLMIALSAWTGGKRRGWRLAAFSVLNPVYWFMHAWAAWRALFQLVVTPFTWEKTPHGLSHHREEASEVS